jgi:hypothetical protein
MPVICKIIDDKEVVFQRIEGGKLPTFSAKVYLYFGDNTDGTMNIQEGTFNFRYKVWNYKKTAPELKPLAWAYQPKHKQVFPKITIKNDDGTTQVFANLQYKHPGNKNLSVCFNLLLHDHSVVRGKWSIKMKRFFDVNGEPITNVKGWWIVGNFCNTCGGRGVAKIARTEQPCTHCSGLGFADKPL